MMMAAMENLAAMLSYSSMPRSQANFEFQDR